MLAAVKNAFRWLVLTGNNSFSWAFALSLLLHLVALGVPLKSPFGKAYPPALTVSLAKMPVPDKQAPEPVPLLAATSPSEDVPTNSHVKPSDIVELTKLRLDLGSASTGNYLPANQVSEPPVLTNPEWLEDAAWRLPAGASGVVVLRIYIGVDGRVEHVGLVDGDASELGEWLADNIREQAHFAAARQNGYAVKSVLTLKLQLRAITHK